MKKRKELIVTAEKNGDVVTLSNELISGIKSYVGHYMGAHLVVKFTVGRRESAVTYINQMLNALKVTSGLELFLEKAGCDINTVGRLHNLLIWYKLKAMKTGIVRGECITIDLTTAFCLKNHELKFI